MSQFGIVSVHYHPRFARRTLRALNDIGTGLPPAHSVCVANQPSALEALQKSGALPGGACDLLQHDNSGMEFGAYQAGYELLRERVDPEWVLFVNDTVENTNNFAPQYRAKLRAWLASDLEEPAIVGMVQSLARSFEIDGVRTHRWMRTHVFAVNRAAMEALGHQVHRTDLDRLVRETTRVPEFFSPDLDPVLRDHMEVWLFRTRPGPHWYKKLALDSGSDARSAARKARSILAEKFLSVRLEAASAAYLDLRELPPLQKVFRKLDDMVFDLRRDAH